MTNISVIMASYLGEYPGCASNRKEKFRRAVDSFLEQKYPHKELIVVSDGCQDTIDIIEKEYSFYLHKEIHLVKLKKQPLFSGNVRHSGVHEAHGDIVCYLDSDDMFGANHLQTIVDNFERDNFDWCFYNDVLMYSKTMIVTRFVETILGSIGTSSIAHKRKLKKAEWKGCDKYNHDWLFIQKLIKNYPNSKRIYGCHYIVRHVHNELES